MKKRSIGEDKPIYLEDTSKTHYPSLEKDLEVDIAIVGGGIVGVTLAYLLKESNKNIALLEAERIVMGMSLKTTAKLTLQHNLIYNELLHTKSPGKAKEYAEANLRAIKFVKNTIDIEKIECDLREVASYLYTINEDSIRKLEDEEKAYRRLGLQATLETNVEDLLSLPIKAALKWVGGSVFNARKYLLKLAERFIDEGGKIYEQTRVKRIEEVEGFYLETEQGKKVYAKKIVIASHYPMYDGMGFYFTKLNPQRVYAITAKVNPGDMPQGAFISIDQPTWSIRPMYEKNVVLIAGGHHRVGDDLNESRHYEELKQFAQDVFKTKEITHHWSTQDYDTPDHMPLIGFLNSSRNQDIYVATGFNKWGMSGGTNAALVLKEMITTGHSPYQDLFNPLRIGSYTGSEFIKHNIDVAKNYLKGKLKSVPKDLYPNKGEAVVTRLEDGNTYGIYVDEESTAYIVDLTCPHMGCELRWNSAEKSWDCPCHGSRYAFNGEVLEGPSTYNLHSYKEGKNEIHPNVL